MRDGRVRGDDARRMLTAVTAWALAYFAAHLVAFYFPDTGRIIMVVWPASGIGLAALLLSPRHRWPWLLTGLTVAGFAADVAVAHRSWAVSAGYMAANVLESLASALLIQRVSGPDVRFHRVRQVVALLGAAVGVNALTACVGAAAAVLATDVTFWDAWDTWYVSDGLGILLVAPLIVMWACPGEDDRPLRPSRVGETLVFLIFLGALTWFAMNPPSVFAVRPYMVGVMLAWPALRLRRPLVPTALLLVAVIAIADEFLHPGVTVLSGASREITLFNIQIFLAFAAAAGYLLMASYSESRVAARDARDGAQRLTLAAEVANIGVWDWDVRSNALVWDDRMYALYGLRREDFSGAYDAWSHALHPDDRQRAEAEINDAVNAGADFITEFRIIRPDGTVRHMKADARSIVDGQGRTLRMVGTNMDVTESRHREEAMRRSEAELRESEGRFRSLANSAPVLIWMADTSKGCTWFNKSWLDFTGRSMEQEAGNGWAEGVHPDDLDRCLRIYGTAFDARQPFSMEYRLRAHDGAYRWITDNAVPRFAADGEFVGYIGSCTDISERKEAEGNLLRERAVLAESQALGHLGSWEWRADTGETKWSAEECRIFGLPSDANSPPYDELLARFIHPDDAGLHDTTFKDAVKKRAPWELENRIVRPDGSVRVVANRARPQFDVHGKLLGYTGSTLDITERKAAEEALQASEMRWQFSVAGTGDGLWDWDLRTNTVFFSSTWKSMLGHTDDEVGDGLDEWSSRVHPDDLPAAMADVQAHLKGLTPIYQNEHRVRHKNGTWLWILDRGVVVSRDATGEPTRVIGTHRDITARKTTEHALALATQQLQGIVEGTGDVVALMDAEYRYTQFNSAFRNEMKRIYGVDAVPGLSMLEMLAHLPEDLANAKAYWTRALGGEDFTVTQEFGDEARARTWYELHFSPVRDDTGAVVGAVHVVRNVSEKKRAERELHDAKERAEAANRAKSAFLANMSHEIRTPLNGVLGHVQLLEMSTLDDEQRGYLHSITTSGNSLLAIINDILDLSKIEADRVTLERAEFSLKPCLNAVIGMERARISAKGLAVSLEFAPEIPAVLVGDELRLKQVMLNLLSNAVKFTERGRITLTAAVREDHGSQVLLELAVADTGVGVSPEAAAKIFDPFVQADSSITRRFGGTGLGLSISRRLIELMGGSVEVESVEGTGSTFRVLLPVAVGTGAGAESAGQAARWDGLALKILLVEDDEISRQFGATLLRKQGHTVTIATDGKLALEALERGEFDLVLMDLQMPVMDGHAALAAVRQRDAARGTRTKVIAVTAFASRNDEAGCLASGFDGFVSKPIHAAWLNSEMHRVLQQVTA